MKWEEWSNRQPTYFEKNLKRAPWRSGTEQKNVYGVRVRTNCMRLSQTPHFFLSFLTCKVELAISLTTAMGRKRPQLQMSAWSLSVVSPTLPLLNFSKWTDKPPIPCSYFSYFKLLLGLLSYCGNWCQQLRFRNALPNEGEESEWDDRGKRQASTQEEQF